MDSFGGGGGSFGGGGGGYMQDGGGFGSPMTDSQEKKVSNEHCKKMSVVTFFLVAFNRTQFSGLDICTRPLAQGECKSQFIRGSSPRN